MNKNIAIGILVALVVLGGGYYLIKSNASKTMDGYKDVTDATPVVQTPEPVIKPVVTTPLTVSAPVVETFPNSSTSSSTAVVTGKVKPNGALTTYWFDYGETTAFGVRSITQSIGSGYSLLGTPGYITGLKANTLYYFRLSAKNKISTVNGNTFSFKTNNTPPVSGIAPTTRTGSATEISRNSADINGNINPNGYVTSYWFEYGKDTSFGNTISFQSAGNGNTLVPVSVSLSNLDPLTKYYFRLNAQNQYGTVNGSVVSFVTDGPASPSEPSVETNSATEIRSSEALLNGNINPNGAETTYWFEYSSDSLLSTVIGEGTRHQTLSTGTVSTKVETKINGLRSNTKYYYRIIGKNAYGTVEGKIVSFRTKS